MPGEITTHFNGMIPMLVCRDVKAEIQFCKDAFGAVEKSLRSGPDGAVIHSTLLIREAFVMIHGEFPSLTSRAPEEDGSSPVVIYLYVDNVDTVLESAVAFGAKILIPPKDQPWGDRVARIVDPSGHVWNLAAQHGMRITAP